MGIAFPETIFTSMAARESTFQTKKRFTRDGLCVVSPLERQRRR